MRLDPGGGHDGFVDEGAEGVAIGQLGGAVVAKLADFLGKGGYLVADARVELRYVVAPVESAQAYHQAKQRLGGVYQGVEAVAAQLELQVVILVDAKHRVVEHAAFVADIRRGRDAQEVTLRCHRSWSARQCIGSCGLHGRIRVAVDAVVADLDSGAHVIDSGWPRTAAAARGSRR